jgi:hypothetical protein
MKPCKKKKKKREREREKENGKLRKRAMWNRGLEEGVYHQTFFPALGREIFVSSHATFSLRDVTILVPLM